VRLFIILPTTLGIHRPLDPDLWLQDSKVGDQLSYDDWPITQDEILFALTAHLRFNVAFEVSGSLGGMY
jgi:hypothetical protein